MLNLDELSVYTRRTGESARAFEAYQSYRDMGAQRSLAGVGQKLGKSKAILERWSSRWEWVRRCEVYDATLAAKDKAAKEQALKDEAQRWAERQIAAGEKDWQKSEQLDKKASEILMLPVTSVERKQTEESKDGKTFITNITVIKGVNTTPRDAAIMAKIASDLRERWLNRMGVGRTPEPQAGGGGMTVGEDIEVIRRKRWIDAAPALLALMEAKQAKLKGGEDENSAEPKAS
jgi:hypothetical protein